MGLATNWRIHVFALCIVILAEFIGIQKFGLIVFLPLFYALAIGGVMSSLPSLKLVTNENMTCAGQFMPIAMLYLVAKIGLGIGPNLHLLSHSGFALIMQEFGHFFGTLIFGLPVALLLKMGREAVGACYSIDREPNVAIIAEKYGISSPEGRGVMGMYICGTLFGALWISILSGVIAKMDLFHPYALAMGAGIGSASMMAASVGSIVAVHPEQGQAIQAYAAAANLMTTVLGIYFALFISLPVTVKVYNLVTGKSREQELLESENNSVMSDTSDLEASAAAITSGSGKAPTLMENLIVLCITGIFCLIGNAIAYKGNFAGDMAGTAVIIAICFVGVAIGRMPVLKKLPTVFWVSILAVIFSIPGMVGAEFITTSTKGINFLATTTPILAYGGLSLGKDLPAFKRLSWRIVPVAIAVASGSFLCAAILAQITLHLEGAI